MQAGSKSSLGQVIHDCDSVHIAWVLRPGSKHASAVLSKRALELLAKRDAHNIRKVFLG